MKDFKEPSVAVEDNKYKISGDFHYIQPNRPIRRTDNNVLCGITNPRQMTYIHSYGGEAIFFENLSKGIIYASRCDNPKCEFKGSIYLPFRIHCPDCLEKNTPINAIPIIEKSATIHTFIMTERTGAFNTLPTPIKFINIEFQGVSTILMSYLVAGEPEIGKQVVPVFRKKEPTYTILDLAWVIKGTKEDQLPKEFSF